MNTLLEAVPFILLIMAIPMSMVFWRSIIKRDFQLALQCLPGLSQAILFSTLLVSLKIFGVVPNLFAAIGSPKANLAFMYSTAAIILLGLAAATYGLVRTKKIRQPLFFTAAALASGFLLHGLITRSHTVIYSAEAFAVAGIIGIAEAFWAKTKGRDAEYDSALGHSGPALVISSIIIGLAYVGM